MTDLRRRVLAAALAVLLAAGLAACRQPDPPGDGGGAGDGARWNEAAWNEDVWN